MIYIRKQHKGFYLETESEIDAEYWAGQIGTTYQDFLNNKWILLSDEQVKFHNEHPYASISEVLNMYITPEQQRTLEQAKEQKLFEIQQYDESDLVNSFNIVVNENTISAWITPEQRSNYKNSIDAAELLGLEEVHPVFDGIQFTLQTQMAKMALAQIQIYADRCYIVTETHKANVEALTTIEEVDEYLYTTGYPEKLTFNL